MWVVSAKFENPKYSLEELRFSPLVPPHNHSSSAKRTLTAAAADVHRFSSRWVENSVFRFHLVHALENFDDDDEFVLARLHTRTL